MYMQLHSHRLKVQEKRLYHKFIKTILLLILSVLFVMYVGLPLFAKFIVFISPKSKEAATTNSFTTVLFAPLLDPAVEATNTATIAISGIADKDTNIKLFVNDQLFQEKPADDEGKFIFQRVKLKEGGNTIYVIETKDDHQSSPSSSINIEYKNKAPQLELQSPEDGKHYSDEPGEITVEGQTDAGNTIIINDRHTVTDSNGKFRYKIKLSDGDNTIKVIAQDDAGNETTIERKVTYSP